jgi:hypothetical protein
MPTREYRAPSYLAISLGILFCVFLIFFIGQLAVITKWSGFILLYLPSRLGIVDIVEPNDVILVDFSTNPTDIYFPHRGAFYLYSDDLDLLSIADEINSSAEPWLVIRSAKSGNTTAVLYVNRGLMPIDTPFAAGRPIYSFYIDKPGSYVIFHPVRPINVHFAPSFSQDNERKLLLVYLVQVIPLIAATVYLLLFKKKNNGRPYR